MSNGISSLLFLFSPSLFGCCSFRLSMVLLYISLFYLSIQFLNFLLIFSFFLGLIVFIFNIISLSFIYCVIFVTFFSIVYSISANTSFAYFSFDTLLNRYTQNSRRLSNILCLSVPTVSISYPYYNLLFFCLYAFYISFYYIRGCLNTQTSTVNCHIIVSGSAPLCLTIIIMICLPLLIVSANNQHCLFL